MRMYAFVLSAVAVGCRRRLLFMAMDMNYGIDFRGGSSIEVQA